MPHPPIILCIGGHDPTGGAGIQADIETVAALGGQAATLVTALTVQDTHDVRAVHPTPPAVFARQFDALRRDLAIDALKIGMLGSAALARSLLGLLEALAVPVVIDPVLAAGGGTDLADAALLDALRALLPLATLLTPNRAEARRLADLPDSATAARALLDRGAHSVLLTGADEATGDRVRNRLYVADAVRDFEWPRLPHRYHGSGCTLASACATALASGEPLTDAVQTAQAFTWRALDAAIAPGGGQRLPRRRP